MQPLVRLIAADPRPRWRRHSPSYTAPILTVLRALPRPRWPRLPSLEAWAYFGGFGDDIFDEADPTSEPSGRV